MITPKTYLMSVVPMLLVLLAIFSEVSTRPGGEDMEVHQIIIDAAHPYPYDHHHDDHHASPCPGYMKYGDYYLMIVEHEMNHAYAKAHCKDHGGRLVVIKDAYMNDAIKTAIGMPIPEGKGYYLGYMYMDAPNPSNSWKAADGTELTMNMDGTDINGHFTNWAITNVTMPDEQWDGSNVDGPEHCVAGKGMHFKWYDEACEQKFMSICECMYHHDHHHDHY